MSNITLNLPFNIDVNIAEIIKSRAENYGYDIPIYVGDNAIRVYYLTPEDELKIYDNAENCKCKKCPYAKKNKNNEIIQTKKYLSPKCNCKKEMEKYYNKYLSKSIAWYDRDIHQIDCKICREVYEIKSLPKVTSEAKPRYRIHEKY